MRLLLLIPLLAPAAAAQEPRARVALHFDGSPLERVRVEGVGRAVHDGRVRVGAASLRVAPSQDDRYFGVTCFDLPAAAPTHLVAAVYLEGDRASRFRIRVDSPGPRAERRTAVVWRRLAPGWNELEVDLAALRPRDGAAPLDLRSGLGRFQLSRRAAPDAPAVVVDHVRLAGERDVARELRRALRDEDGRVRTRALRTLGPALPAPERGAALVKALLGDRDERVRRAAREVLARCSAPASVAAVRQALERTPAEQAPELAWVLGAMPSAGAREAALALARDRRAAETVRTAAVQGLAREGARDLADLVPDLSPRHGWRPRAALAAALHASRDAAGVDGLIALLEGAAHPRVRHDAAGALAGLTGRDLGAEAAPWARWWAVNREGFRPTTGASGPRRRYGRFFGIPVVQGDVAFVLDVSGSMRDPVRGGRAEAHVAGAGHLDADRIRTRLDLAKAELLHALSGLRKPSRVAVVAYNDEVLRLTDGLEPVTPRLVGRLRMRVRGLGAGQKTNIHDALLAALFPRAGRGAPRGSCGPDTVYLLSDGHPSAGPIRRATELRDAVLRWNLGRAVRIHTVNVGDGDGRLLRPIAAGSGGRYVDLRSDEDQVGKEGKRP